MAFFPLPPSPVFSNTYRSTSRRDLHIRYLRSLGRRVPVTKSAAIDRAVFPLKRVIIMEMPYSTLSLMMPAGITTTKFTTGLRLCYSRLGRSLSGASTSPARPSLRWQRWNQMWCGYTLRRRRGYDESTVEVERKHAYYSLLHRCCIKCRVLAPYYNKTEVQRLRFVSSR